MKNIMKLHVLASQKSGEAMVGLSGTEWKSKGKGRNCNIVCSDVVVRNRGYVEEDIPLCINGKQKLLVYYVII